jgi:hypothetical protein
MDGIDVTGDIHGHADALERLLQALGYPLQDGVHRHRTRSVVFAGDCLLASRRGVSLGAARQAEGRAAREN